MQERKIIALLRERDQQGLHALLVHDGPLCDTSSPPFCGALRSGRIVFPRRPCGSGRKSIPFRRSGEAGMAD